MFDALNNCATAAYESINVSLGTVYSLKPFFVAYPNENYLCLCKLCLNVSLLHESLKKKARQDGEEHSTTPTAFFMHGCTCSKTVGGYYSWPCVTGKCKNCKKIKPYNLKCQSFLDLTSVSHIQTVAERKV